MSLNRHYALLFEYHFSLNQKLLNLTHELSPALLNEEQAYGHGSLPGIFDHLLRTDRSWRLALETGRQVPEPNPGDYAQIPSLSAGFDAERMDWKRLIVSLDDITIGGQIELISTRGKVFQFEYWRILQHVILHGMQHHSEIARLLTELGESPGNIDFIFYDL